MQSDQWLRKCLTEPPVPVPSVSQATPLIEPRQSWYFIFQDSIPQSGRMSYCQPDRPGGPGQHPDRSDESQRVHHQDQQLAGGGETQKVSGAQWSPDPRLSFPWWVEQKGEEDDAGGEIAECEGPQWRRYDLQDRTGRLREGLHQIFPRHSGASEAWEMAGACGGSRDSGSSRQHRPQSWYECQGQSDKPQSCWESLNISILFQVYY